MFGDPVSPCSSWNIVRSGSDLFFMFIENKRLERLKDPRMFVMGKSQLIHNNEFHLISKAEIRKATGKLVESLNLAAGSTDGFDIYKVVDAYFTDLDKRHEVNALLGIGESCQYYGEQEQVEEVIKEVD